jgi:hypothetical protein
MFPSLDLRFSCFFNNVKAQVLLVGCNNLVLENSKKFANKSTSH